MQTVSRLPSGWALAHKHFANLSDQQLEEQGLPPDERKRKKALQHVYTNGTQFAYCRGQRKDVAFSLGKKYTSWHEARKSGQKRFKRYSSKRKARLDSARTLTGSLQYQGDGDSSGTDAIDEQDDEGLPSDSNTTPSAPTQGSPHHIAPSPTTWVYSQPAFQPQQVTSLPARAFPAALAPVPQPPLLPWPVPAPDFCKKSAYGAPVTGMSCPGGECWPGAPQRLPPPPLPPRPPLPPPPHTSGFVQQVTGQQIGTSLPPAAGYGANTKLTAPASQSAPDPAYTVPAANISGGMLQGRETGTVWQTANVTTPSAFEKPIGRAFGIAAALQLPPQQPPMQQLPMQGMSWCCQGTSPGLVVPAALGGISQYQTGVELQNAAAQNASCPGFMSTNPAVGPAGGAGGHYDVRTTKTLQLQQIARHPSVPNQQQVAMPQTYAGSSERNRSAPLNAFSADLHDAADLSGMHRQPMAGSAARQSQGVAESPAPSRLRGGRAWSRGQGKSVAALAADSADANEPLIWHWRMELFHPVTLKPTGQQLLMSPGRDIGSGGYGRVHEVNVKLCGSDSLTAMKGESPALEKLLQRTPCYCGAVLPEHQQGSDHHADRCRCSVQMALKVQPYNQETLDQVDREYSIMNDCWTSPYVVDCYAMGSMEYAGKQLCLLMELSKLGSMEQHYSLDKHSASHGLDAVQTQKLVRQVTQGVADVHDKAKAVHRDLKWENVLLFGDKNAPRVKICDFGLSTVLAVHGQYAHSAVGTPGWFAPEQTGSRGEQDWRLDSFQIGVLVLALRTGRMPLWWPPWCFEKIDPLEIANELLKTLDDRKSPYNKTTGSHTALGATEKAFVKSCIEPNPQMRPSAYQLLMDHEYLGPNYGGG